MDTTSTEMAKSLLPEKTADDVENGRAHSQSFEQSSPEKGKVHYDLVDFDGFKAVNTVFGENGDDYVMPSKCGMLKHFARLAGPSVITNVFSYMVMTVNTIFAG